MRKLGLVVLLLFLVFSFFASVACGEELESFGEGGTEEEQKRGRDGGGGRCSTDADCNYNGECQPVQGQDIAFCLCDERYAGEYCQDRRKNKLTAFLLSLLLGGVAADRFYLGFIGLGLVKLLLNLLGFVPACIANWATVCMNGRYQYEPISSGMSGEAYLCWAAGNCVSCCLSFGALAWWLTDWILILKDKLGDASGYSLYDNL